jgi:toxin ParE1/3/4
MQLIWSRPAIIIRRAIFDRIRVENPTAAKRIVIKLRDRANSLQTMPHQGRAGRVSGTYELVIANTPYIIVFAIEGDEVRILTILHHAQQWPALADK